MPSSSTGPIIMSSKENNEKLIENIKELKKSINKLDKSTSFYSKRVLWLSILMIVMMVIQIYVAILNWNGSIFNQIIAGIFSLSLISFSFYALNKALEEENIK